MFIIGHIGTKFMVYIVTVACICMHIRGESLIKIKQLYLQISI